MRKTTILNGKFTSGEGTKGNFTGYNAAGERIFISKAQMEGIGIKEDKDVKFPLFSIVGEREFETMDADGNGTGVMFTRLQSLSVFKTAEELIKASNSDAKLEIESKVDLQKTASTAGLSEEVVNKLLAAVI